ncbi:hypothetical protein F5B21DRAFT_490315 [Xylaria acuta]|nr:hypothetical protein F5B21DRAFT_490315 [Xylaria acuta]
MSARVLKVLNTSNSESSGSTNASSAGDNDGNGGNGGDEFAFLFPKTTAGGGFESLPGTPGSSDSSPDGSGDFNPPAFPAYMAPQSHKSDSEASDEGSPPSSPFLSNVSSAHRNSRITSGPKLHPHDIYQLSDSYLYHISRRYGFGGPDWRRIEWLPYPGGPPDPGQGHPNGGPESMRHAVTDTRAGLATILGVDSGAAVAELLIANDRDDRANYNFGAYDSETLNLPGWKRTLEFREAGGSLDPDWIITWASICVGILRFCRDASVIDFITVLERVVREEERQRTADPESDDEGMYDVCDLLEDMCLFAEATTIRERERKLGPPR